MMNDLRLQVFEHIQELSLSYFDKTHQGRIINRADADIDAMEQVLSWGANQLLASLITLIGVFCIMLSYSWRLCLVVSVVLPPLHRWRRLFSADISCAGASAGAAAIVAPGRLRWRRIFRACAWCRRWAAKTRTLDNFQELSTVYIDRAYDVARIFHTYMPTLGLVSGIGVALVLGRYAGTLVLQAPPLRSDAR